MVEQDAPRSAAQPFLFSEQTIKELTAAEKQGRYTLERLRKLRPEVIEEIIRLRAENLGKLRIAQICHVHHETVTAVDMAYAEPIDIARAARVARLRSAADKIVECIEQNPGLVPWNAKALAAAQLYDKAELLDGRATVRAEHTESVDIYATWNEFLEKVIDVSSETGLDGEKKPAIEPGPETDIARLPYAGAVLEAEEQHP
jgi:hypothetical protein